MAGKKKVVELATDVVADAVAAKAKTEYEEVPMDDGEVVRFPGKRRLLKSSSIASDGTLTTRFDFRNGEVRKFVINGSNELFAKFAAHGIEQKIGDEVAGLEDVEDMLMAIDDVIERLGNGDWAAKRENNGMAGASVLAKALLKAKPGSTMEQIKGFLKTKTNAEKLALRQNPKIAPIVAELEAGKKKKEKAAVDTDSLLDELAA